MMVMCLMGMDTDFCNFVYEHLLALIQKLSVAHFLWISPGINYGSTKEHILRTGLSNLCWQTTEIENLQNGVT